MNTQSSPSLEDFAEKLLEERGTDGVDAEIREQMKKDLTDRLEDRINMALVEKLSPQYLEEAERLIDEGNAENVQKFFQDHIADVSEVIATELVLFRQRYLNTL